MTNLIIGFISGILFSGITLLLSLVLWAMNQDKKEDKDESKKEQVEKK